jgi:valyl-tRNA synthetase
MIVHPILQGSSFDEHTIQLGEEVKEMIVSLRDIRARSGLKNTALIKTYFTSEEPEKHAAWHKKIMRLCNSEVFECVAKEVADAQTFVIKSNTYFVITGIELNVEHEREKLQKELTYVEGFLKSIHIKMSNEKFVNNAPAAVLEAERKKLADGEAKQKALIESLEKLQ